MSQQGPPLTSRQTSPVMTMKSAQTGTAVSAPHVYSHNQPETGVALSAGGHPALLDTFQGITLTDSPGVCTLPESGLTDKKQSAINPTMHKAVQLLDSCALVSTSGHVCGSAVDCMYLSCLRRVACSTEIESEQPASTI